MKDKTIEAFIAHAKEQYPTEACGLVVELHDTRQEVFLPAVNIAADPTVVFMIHPVFFADASDIGDIRAVFYSHPEGPDQCSEGDRVACNEAGIPYYVVALYRQSNGEFQASMPFGIAPSGIKAPLLGRIFIHGIYDCYAVIRDWFSTARGVTLPDHVRQDNWWKKTPELDLYAANLETDGWRVMAEDEPLKPGDMILMQLESKVMNHAALYLGTEALAEAPDGYPKTDRILHHVYGRRSRVDMYAGMWKHCTVKVARHESQE